MLDESTLVLVPLFTFIFSSERRRRLKRGLRIVGRVEEACLINNTNDPSRLTTAVIREKEGKEGVCCSNSQRLSLDTIKHLSVAHAIPDSFSLAIEILERVT